jgi:hypothetical protein
MGVNARILDKSGAWYAYNGEKIGQGRDNAREFLRENPTWRARSRTRCVNRWASRCCKPGQTDAFPGVPGLWRRGDPPGRHWS